MTLRNPYRGVQPKEKPRAPRRIRRPGDNRRLRTHPRRPAQRPKGSQIPRSASPRLLPGAIARRLPFLAPFWPDEVADARSFPGVTQYLGLGHSFDVGMQNAPLPEGSLSVDRKGMFIRSPMAPIDPYKFHEVMPPEVPMFEVLPYKVVITPRPSFAPETSPHPEKRPLLVNPYQPYEVNDFTTAVDYTKKLMPWIDPVYLDNPLPGFSINFNNQTAQVRYERTANQARYRRKDKPQRDTKTRSQLAYFAFVSFLNQTFGRVSEVLDFYEALQWNVYYPDGRTAAQRGVGFVDIASDVTSGVAELDQRGLVIDIFVTQVTDAVTGKLGKRFADEKDAVRSRASGVDVTTFGRGQT